MMMKSKFLLFLVFAIPLLGFVPPGYSLVIDYPDNPDFNFGNLGEETSHNYFENVNGSLFYDYDYSSADTITWTAQTAPYGLWKSVTYTYGNGLFVAHADFGDESVIYICVVKEKDVQEI